ncbi:Apolipoprotein D [Armadillidium vulgare]|nr:Apolipoprotein D [Armadillidium vulgare]
MRNFEYSSFFGGVIWPTVFGIKFSSSSNANFLGNGILSKFYCNQLCNKCMTMTFERLTDTEFQVIQAREFTLLDKVNIDYRHQYTGTLKMTDSNRPSEMKIKWPSHIIGSATFRVVDTDYDKYALINDCQNLFVVARLSFAILSRERTLDEETVNMLRQKIRDMDIDTSPLNAVDQFSCEGGSGTGTGTGSGTGTGTGTGTETGTGTRTGTGNRDETDTADGNSNGTGGGEEFPTDRDNSTEPIEANFLALLDDKQIAKIKDTYHLAEHLNWQVTKEELHKDDHLPDPKTGGKKDKKQ